MSVSIIEDFKEHYAVVDEFTWVVKDFNYIRRLKSGKYKFSTPAGKNCVIQTAVFRSHNGHYLWTVYLTGFDCSSGSEDRRKLDNNEDKNYYYVEVLCSNLTKTIREKKVEIFIGADENYKVYKNGVSFFNYLENSKEIKLFEAKQSDQLVNYKDDLTIVFRISEVFSIVMHSDSQHLQKLSCDYEELLKSGDHSDFKIIIGKKEFPVHKNILSARSDYFSAMFRHDTVEQTNNFVKLPDVCPEVMSEVLHYIYCGTINMTEDSVYDFLIFADVYQMKDLQEKCEEAIVEYLNIGNVGDCIAFAEQHNNNFLREAIADFFIKHATTFPDEEINVFKLTLTTISSPFMANLVYRLLLKIRN